PPVYPGILAVCLSFIFASTTGAQSAEELQAAGQAFQQGQRAQVRGDVAPAAEFFDLANQTAPSAPALRSAMRMHQAAGHHAIAATRAMQARSLYPSDPASLELASQVLAQCGPLVVHVVVTCTPGCGLTVDGRVASVSTGRAELYLEPGSHVVRANWGGHRVLERSLDSTPGSSLELVLDESDPDAVAPEPARVETEATRMLAERTSEDASSSTGISPAFFGVTLSLTVLAVAGTIGLGVSVLDAQAQYIRMPTERRWRDGVALESATNWLLGGSIAAAALTFVFALFTDWDGEPSGERRARLPDLRLTVTPDGAAACWTALF
ncbi:MAG: hypothetical protein ACK5U8_01185, partial [Deltaproteobacteria bacterium]